MPDGLKIKSSLETSRLHKQGATSDGEENGADEGGRGRPRRRKPMFGSARAAAKLRDCPKARHRQRAPRSYSNVANGSHRERIVRPREPLHLNPVYRSAHCPASDRRVALFKESILGARRSFDICTSARIFDIGTVAWNVSARPFTLHW